MEVLSELSHGALLTILYTAGPLLAVILVTGVAVSVLLALTQVNEPTLSFIPKFLGTSAALALFGPFLLHQLEAFTVGVFTSLPRILQ
jgi:flagellar biosynthesis protein FliQ